MKHKKRKGMLLYVDDLNVGDYIAVHSMKGDPNHKEILGIALKVKAVELPFVLGQPVMNSKHPPVTLDVRYMDLMRVSEEYARAQASSDPIMSIPVEEGH